MPICVHCSTPTQALYVSYGPQHLICTKCKACGAFADPYVEHEAIIVVIDLILVKPRAYRHLLFNRKDVFAQDDTRKKVKESPATTERKAWLLLARHFLALLLVDAYLRWFYLCRDHNTSLQESMSGDLSTRLLVLWSYFNILWSTCTTMLTLHTVVLLWATVYHRAVRWIAQRQTDSSRSKIDQNELQRFKMHLIPNALLLSSLTPTFLLCLLLLWQPLSHSSEDQKQPGEWQWNEASIDWAIRSLVSGLSAGVGLGVVLPLQRTKVGALMATTILMIGWYLQFVVSQKLGMPFHSGVGVLQSDEGQIAAKLYCLAN
ncbi:Arv1-domain-containing protein [Meira miltonrushii]|uniref:Protein ARV n=1 Tax=Meira miltonrushii TaxID=1280837 RepID=A0A316V868_9BASI|nr:Arv1-domain-containing protein [Meira miltonrushii]PWN33228.1 Arv1-domain-containing protein [Meira miltonrushii]